MAIDPSVSFPGQVDVTDLAAYPLGKAQNEDIEGDGTGTPWTADLVNDIFGFQQALLDYAGITANESPDEVGASQYLDALTDADWQWTGDVDLAGASNELGYASARTRTITRLFGCGGGGLQRSDDGLGNVSISAVDPSGVLSLVGFSGTAVPNWMERLDLPIGAVVTNIKIAANVGAGVGAGMAATFYKRADNFTTGADGTPASIDTDSTSSAGDVVLSLDAAETIAAGSVYYLRLAGANEITSVAYSYQVTFTETRATGHY